MNSLIAIPAHPRSTRVPRLPRPARVARVIAALLTALPVAALAGSGPVAADDGPHIEVEPFAECMTPNAHVGAKVTNSGTVPAAVTLQFVRADIGEVIEFHASTMAPGASYSATQVAAGDVGLYMQLVVDGVTSTVSEPFYCEGAVHQLAATMWVDCGNGGLQLVTHVVNDGNVVEWVVLQATVGEKLYEQSGFVNPGETVEWTTALKAGSALDAQVVHDGAVVAETAVADAASACGPEAPNGPSDPMDPTVPTVPTVPADPMDPTVPAEPVQPTVPAEPTVPAPSVAQVPAGEPTLPETGGGRTPLVVIASVLLLAGLGLTSLRHSGTRSATAPVA